MRHSKTPAMQVLLVLLLVTAGGVMASPGAADDAVTLNLQQAVTKALANNPGIEAARIDANIAKARSETLALGTPFRLQGEIENVGGSGEFSGFDASESTLSVAKTLETGDKRLWRQSLGDSRLELASIEIAAREAQVAAETSRRYVHLLQLQEASALSAESLAISTRTHDIVRKRVAVGRASEAEESSASVSLARTELESQRVGFEIVAAKTALSLLWGTTNPAFASVNGNLYSMPEIPDYESAIAGTPGGATRRDVQPEYGRRTVGWTTSPRGKRRCRHGRRIQCAVRDERAHCTPRQRIGRRTGAHIG
jgi:cobalt-zinc-cadmium efflux system outer membrane protein